MYEYAAIVTRILDGDTVEAEIDLGFKLKYKTMVRLDGIAAPELREEGGYASKAALMKLLDTTARQVVIRTRMNNEFEKYGRVLGTLYAKWPQFDPRQPSINFQLVQNGAAREA